MKPFKQTLAILHLNPLKKCAALNVSKQYKHFMQHKQLDKQGEKAWKQKTTEKLRSKERK